MAAFYVDKYGETIERMHASMEPRGFPEVYVNQDVTITIDPPTKNGQMWIRDKDDAHLRECARERGATKDKAGVMRALEVLKQQPQPDHTFVAHSEHLAALDKYSGKCVADSTHGERHHAQWVDMVGDLPVISKLIWENKLPDTPSYTIERQMWSQRYANNRAFDESESPR
jgi:hypothetical protein